MTIHYSPILGYNGRGVFYYIMARGNVDANE